MKNLMDIGNNIANGIEPEIPKENPDYIPFESILESYFDLSKSNGLYPKEDSDFKRIHKDIELLELINEKFKNILKPEYCANEKKNVDEIHEIVTHEINPIFFDSNKNKNFILRHLYNRDSFLNQIKDKRFHAYFVTRCNLQLLLEKIKKSESQEYGYTIPNIVNLIHNIDGYILQYLFALLIYSNAENMILFTKKKAYKKKAEREKRNIAKQNKLRTI